MVHFSCQNIHVSVQKYTGMFSVALFKISKHRKHCKYMPISLKVMIYLYTEYQAFMEKNKMALYALTRKDILVMLCTKDKLQSSICD